MNSFLPICIDVSQTEILIVGGGRVALKKLEGLERYSRKIKVVSPEICQGIRSRTWVNLHEKPYSSDDLEGHFLVFAATDNEVINRTVLEDGKALGCLVNVVDDPAVSGFVSPAIYKHSHMSVAVSSNGQNVLETVRWRNEIKKLIEDGAIGSI
ncbi:MAG: bifunctional precorrin-2 dehydrogenase/sirohydrochlorin ferrochelatase [Breznakibacter sp.]